MRENAGLIAVVVLVLLCVGALAGRLGYEVGVRSERSAAIQNNAGEYQCDPSTGEEKFVYHLMLSSIPQQNYPYTIEYGGQVPELIGNYSDWMMVEQADQENPPH